MTKTVHKLARLGLVLTGTNEDLILPQPESKGTGEGESEEEGDETSEDEEGTGSGDSDDTEEADEDTEGSGNGSDEDAEGEDDAQDGEGEGSDDGEEGEDTTPGGSDDGDPEDGEGEEPGQPGGDSEPQDDSGDAEGDSEGEDTGEPGGEPGEPSDGKDGDPEEQGESQEGDPGESREEKTDGAGGAGGMDEEEARTLAQELIDAIHDGDDETGLLDNNDALGEAIDAKAEEEEENCEENEQVWRPYDPSLDIVRVVDGGNVKKARRLRKKVKKEISYLRTKLRSKFLQARAPRTVHGVRKGRDLSERRLVSSVVELRSGRRPTRPDWDRHQGDDVTLAAAVVLDQSGSMGVKLAAKAAAAALAIATPLDELGSPCLVVGPRSGGAYSTGGRDLDPRGANCFGANGRPRFHRTSGITIDIFKDWEEPMTRALPRFSEVTSTGYTPLSDGIQYAMQHINDRPERHRVILVVTDGQPDCPDVVRRQIRLAAEAGVHVVGVGISSGCWAVTRLFPTHVAVNNLNELPREMMKVLTSIVFPKRGKRIALDGKM